MTTQKAEAADESADDDARAGVVRSEEALPDGELLRAVFADLGAGLYLTDHTGRISAVNPCAALLLERPAAALVGADAHDLLHRDAHGAPRPRSACEPLAVLQHGRAVRGDDECGTFLRGSGRLLPIAWTASPIRRNGRLCGTAVLFVDAGERRAAARRQTDHLAALEHLAGRLATVTEISTMLSRTLEIDEALTRLGCLLVPRLADWAAVELRTGPEEVRRVAVIPRAVRRQAVPRRRAAPGRRITPRQRVTPGRRTAPEQRITPRRRAMPTPPTIKARRSGRARCRRSPTPPGRRWPGCCAAATPCCWARTTSPRRPTRRWPRPTGSCSPPTAPPRRSSRRCAPPARFWAP
nr:hypothetical protein GCM10020093_022090 [Planobispora longispora]